MITSVHISKNLGRYNFVRPVKNWMVSMHVQLEDKSHIEVSEIWDEDDEPDIEDKLPSDVLSIIEERIDSWWISTSREKNKEMIAQIRSFGNGMDIVWLKRKIESTIRQLNDYENQLSSIEAKETQGAAEAGV